MPWTILCVDDDRGPLETLTEALATQGHRFLHTASPDEALGWVRTEKLDLILIEIALASGDGLALLEQIRSCGAEASQPPIIVLTRLEREPGCYGRSLELGARDFLTKPVSRGQLLDCVRTFCANTQTVVDVARRAEDGPCETLSDDLASPPLAGLLHQLHARGASGVLIVERTGGRTAVQMRNGSFVSASSGRNLESFEDFLVRTKRIDQEQREALIEQMSFGTGSRSEILIGMGVMSESEVTAALFDHADQGLVDAFAWPAPRFRFLPGKKLKPSSSNELNRSVGSTILRGVMAQMPIETIRASLGENDSLFVVEGENPLYPLEELELDSRQKAFLEEIDADRTVSELRAKGEAVERMLYGFSSIGMVELSAEPPLMLMDVVEQEVGIEKPDAQPSTASSDQGDADRVKLSPSDARVEGASVPEALRGMLSDLVERMVSQDDFEVLGIAEAAADTEVQAAHDEQLRSLNLDRILAHHPDLRALVDAARERLATALENLRSAELRSCAVEQRLERKKSEEAEELAKRALEAESWFRKGDRFLTQRSYEKAVEAFGMAAHLDPAEGEYVAHLGYSLYLSKPGDSLIQRESLEHIAKGIKMSPEREKSFLFLGRIFKAIGKTKNARGMFRRALKIRPEFHPARQELRLLDMREAKKQKKGFLDRLTKK